MQPGQPAQLRYLLPFGSLFKTNLKKKKKKKKKEKKDRCIETAPWKRRKMIKREVEQLPATLCSLFMQNFNPKKRTVAFSGATLLLGSRAERVKSIGASKAAIWSSFQSYD